MGFKTLEWKNGRLFLLDQTRLPGKECYAECSSYREVARAIKDMVVRGAPAIGVAAAFGMEYLNKTLRNEDDIEEQIGLPVLATIQYYGDLRPVRQIATEENI